MPTTVVKSVGSRFSDLTDASNTSPIVITTVNNPHGFLDGERVEVINVVGNTAANGDWVLANVTATTAELVGSSGNGAYVSGGRVKRNYAELSDWESNTQGDLVAADEVRIGEFYADGELIYLVPSFAARHTIAGSTVDSTRYRAIRAAPGHRFSPVAPGGVTFLRDPGASATFVGYMRIQENYFRMEGIGVVYEGGDPSLPSGTFTEHAIEIDADFVRIDGVAAICKQGTITGEFAGIGDGSGDTDNQVWNCIVIGAGIPGRGFNSGIRITATTSRVTGCSVYNISGTHDTGSLFCTGFNTGSTPHTNCIAIDCHQDGSEAGFLDFSGSGSPFTDCISSDDTGDYAINVEADTLFVSPAGDDLRNRFNSPAIDAGTDPTTITGGADNDHDFDGVARDDPADIGAYNSVYIPTPSNPTEIISSIGTGLDYDTVQEWLDATKKNLIIANERHIGEMHGVEALGTTAINVTGAATDSERYRHLRAASGAFFNPILNVGAKLTFDGTTFEFFAISENYFRLEGLRLQHLNTGTTVDATCVLINANNTRVNRCFADIFDGTPNSRGRISYYIESGTGNLITNCIAHGDADANGATHGFRVAGSSNIVANCVSRRARQGASGVAFLGEGTNNTVWNCACAQPDTGFSGWDVEDYCAAPDTSPTGDHSIQNIGASDFFVDPGCVGLQAQSYVRWSERREEPLWLVHRRLRRRDARLPVGDRCLQRCCLFAGSRVSVAVDAVPSICYLLEDRTS